MDDRIIVKEGEVHKVRKPMDVGPIYQLIRYCYENDLRFGQVFCSLFYTTPDEFFFMENSELERRIKEFIANGKQAIKTAR